MLTRDQLHRLIDVLPDDQLGGLAEAAERTMSPALLAALLAPEDDEPLTEADIEALREADEAIARGEVFTHEEVKRRHGL